GAHSARGRRRGAVRPAVLRLPDRERVGQPAGSHGRMSRVLVVDSHDSFVHTLADYLVQLAAEVDLIEADEVVDPAAAIAGYDGVLISPGPGAPRDAGASIGIVRAAAEKRMPVLGVCLGH